jgi:hypothetical protein
LGFILGKPKYALICSVNSTVSIRVRREVVELADKMVRYELARSRSHAFNILIERGLSEVVKEVGFWEEVYRDVEELEKSGFKISHDGLNRLLDEGEEPVIYRHGRYLIICLWKRPSTAYHIEKMAGCEIAILKVSLMLPSAASLFR